MGKYRTQELFCCPYCRIAGFFKRGQRDNHIRKSHPGKLPIEGSGITEKLGLTEEELKKNMVELRENRERAKRDK